MWLATLRPRRWFFLRRVLPAGVGLVLGWILAGYVTELSNSTVPPPSNTPPAAPEPSGQSNQPVPNEPKTGDTDSAAPDPSPAPSASESKFNTREAQS